MKTHTGQFDGSDLQIDETPWSYIEKTPVNGDSSDTIPEIIDRITHWQRIRNDFMRMQTAVHNKMCGIIRRVVDCGPNESPRILKELPHDTSTHGRVKLDNPSSDHILVELGDKQFKIPHWCIMHLFMFRDFHKESKARRKSYESLMESEVKKLPIWKWAEPVRGIGPLLLALLVGEVGALSKYPNPAKVWKRFGVAVIEGERQGFGLKNNAPKALVHGYSPRRRSVLWQVGDVLIKSNRDGVYKKLYDERKIEEAKNPELKSKMHIHRRAQRYMEKRLLVDMWEAWNKLT